MTATSTCENLECESGEPAAEFIFDAWDDDQFHVCTECAEAEVIVTDPNRTPRPIEDPDPIHDIDTESLWQELARRSNLQIQQEDARRDDWLAAHNARTREAHEARAKAERERKERKWAEYAEMVEERDRKEKRAAKVAALISDRHAARALWNLPSFDTIATTGEHDGRSGQDDIDDITALDFAAVDYVAGSNTKFLAARRVNESKLHGEYDDQGNWRPLFHREARKDGSTFKRFVSEQPHHVSDVHQLDGGEIVIVAVQVDEDRFHTMLCHKRRLDMRIIPQRNLWARLHPNRNIPMRSPLQFIYEPERYIASFHADDAADLAWRWASESSIERDFRYEDDQ